MTTERTSTTAAAASASTTSAPDACSMRRAWGGGGLAPPPCASGMGTATHGDTCGLHPGGTGRAAGRACATGAPQRPARLPPAAGRAGSRSEPYCSRTRPPASGERRHTRRRHACWSVPSNARAHDDTSRAELCVRAHTLVASWRRRHWVVRAGGCMYMVEGCVIVVCRRRLAVGTTRLAWRRSLWRIRPCGRGSQSWHLVV